MKEYHYKDFSIYSGNDVFDTLLQNLIEEGYSQVFVLTDENTEKYCLPILKKHLFNITHISTKSGESHKTLATAETIWQALLSKEADKHSVLINLGGGMVGDLGGFCASLYKRGIDYIQVPTSLLAMIDAAIGGKTAVDFGGIKNMIGTIQQPKSVYIYPEFLASLPHEETLNGYAEMMKHGLISDKDYWQKIQQVSPQEWPNLLGLINGSIKIKMNIVTKDPYEKNERKLLNFGHTIGHAIEAYSLQHDKKPLKHGESIAIGMICEAYLSKVVLDLSNKELRQITELVSRTFPKYSLRNILSPELIKIMRQDKKNMNDQIQFSLLKKIGKGQINHTCSDSQITASLNYYDAL